MARNQRDEVTMLKVSLLKFLGESHVQCIIILNVQIFGLNGCRPLKLVIFIIIIILQILRISTIENQYVSQLIKKL